MDDLKPSPHREPTLSVCGVCGEEYYGEVCPSCEERRCRMRRRPRNKAVLLRNTQIKDKSRAIGGPDEG